MSKVRIGIIGVGNCASGLLQGIQFYQDNPKDTVGQLNEYIGDYGLNDIEFVSAFDVGSNKIGKSLSKAIFEAPNTVNWVKSVSNADAIVKESPIFDGVGHFVKDKISPLNQSKSLEQIKQELIQEIKDTETDVLLSYLPVGSQKATEFWAEVALETGCGFVNCVPVFIASNPIWAKKFSDANVPIVGDDIKAQLGATIVHRTLAKLCSDRGCVIDKTYQINVGGNTDFLNMREIERLESKKISKTESVQSVLPERIPDESIYVGPSDYIPHLGNTKLCFIRIEGRMFSQVPFNLELRLDVDDKANSAGIAVDAARICKIALDRKIGGPVIEASAWLMKHPPKQMPDTEALSRLDSWISGK